MIMSRTEGGIFLTYDVLTKHSIALLGYTSVFRNLIVFNGTKTEGV
jgi:hypothetical protein